MVDELKLSTQVGKENECKVYIQYLRKAVYTKRKKIRPRKYIQTPDYSKQEKKTERKKDEVKFKDGEAEAEMRTKKMWRIMRRSLSGSQAGRLTCLGQVGVCRVHVHILNRKRKKKKEKTKQKVT